MSTSTILLSSLFLASRVQASIKPEGIWGYSHGSSKSLPGFIDGTNSHGGLTVDQWKSVSALPDIEGVFTIHGAPDISQFKLNTRSGNANSGYISIAAKNNVPSPEGDSQENTAVSIEMLPSFSLTNQGGIQSDGMWYACLYLYEMDLSGNNALLTPIDGSCAEPLLTANCKKELLGSGFKSRNQMKVQDGNLGCPDLEDIPECKSRFPLAKPSRQAFFSSVHYDESLNQLPSAIFDIYSTDPNTLAGKSDPLYDTPWVVQAIWSHIDDSNGAAVAGNDTVTTITCLQAFEKHPENSAANSPNNNQASNGSSTGSRQGSGNGNDGHDEHEHPLPSAASFLGVVSSWLLFILIALVYPVL